MGQAALFLCVTVGAVAFGTWLGFRLAVLIADSLLDTHRGTL